MLYFYPPNTREKYVKEEPQDCAQYGQKCNERKWRIPFLEFSNIGLYNPLFSFLRIPSPEKHKCQGRSKKENENKAREKVENKMLEIPQFKKMQNRSSRGNA
jgi:hypothetical protein